VKGKSTLPRCESIHVTAAGGWAGAIKTRDGIEVGVFTDSVEKPAKIMGRLHPGTKIDKGMLYRVLVVKREALIGGRA
jgi:hypothetical protein